MKLSNTSGPEVEVAAEVGCDEELVGDGSLESGFWEPGADFSAENAAPPSILLDEGSAVWELDGIT